MRRKTVSGIMLALLLISMLTLAFDVLATASLPVHNIDTGLDYGTIQEAIDANETLDGHTILVDAGIYYEHVAVNKSVSLVGENEETTIIDGSRTGYVVSVTADNVTIHGFTIQNGGHGIYVYHSDNTTISGNIISKNGGSTGGYCSHAIFMRFSDGNMISDNEISNNPAGIGFFEECDANIIMGNRITNNRDGGVILSFGSDYNIISNNTITSGFFGIFVCFDSNDNTISDNIVSLCMCDEMIGCGIFISGSCDRNEIIGNSITNSDSGIFVGIGSNSQIIKNNTISNNYYGIEINDCNECIIFHNNFIDNKKHVFIHRGSLCPPPVNVWDGSYPFGGNYWSDYGGVDLCSGPYQNETGSDGIGDKAYVIDENNQDSYPLMYPWGSPPPPSYTLTIYSSPTGVTFTVDGVSRTTPWSGTYSKGSSVSLEMLETHDGYEWSHWQEDGDPKGIKTVTMDTNITLTGIFTPVPPSHNDENATSIDEATNKSTNESKLETPWIWLTTIILPLVLTVVYVKKRKRNT